MRSRLVSASVVPCFHPLHGFRARVTNPSGKRGVVFTPSAGFVDLPVTVPCGRCIGCRLERSRQWAVRCMHEASLHVDNSFVTLTYRDEDLRPGASLVKRDFQLFMKRLRKFFGNERISYFHCGEYGEQLGRPHYHALLFGVYFPDQSFYKAAGDGSDLFRSPVLDRLWALGDCLIGAVTFESAAYVARYCVKKINGPGAAAHYEYVDPETGECSQRLPEYVTMSTRPAIGRSWYDKFGTETFQNDTVVCRGREMKPPRYYDRLHEMVDCAGAAEVKYARIRYSKKPKARANSTPERLVVREAVAKARVTSLKRNLGHA